MNFSRYDRWRLGLEEPDDEGLCDDPDCEICCPRPERDYDPDPEPIVDMRDFP